MSKVYTSAVVIIPPEDTWEQIQEIREKYDRNFHRWMPHITLLYPFRPEVEYNALKGEFEKVCKNLKSFEVKLQNFKYFHHKKQQFTIWLEPKPKISVIQLQKVIQQIVPDCNNVSLHKEGFIPHLSLGQKTGKDLMLKTMQELQSQWKSFKFIVDKIHFISRENNINSKFVVKKSIRLPNK